MRIILRTMDLPGKSAALHRPRKSPIGTSFTSLAPASEIIHPQYPLSTLVLNYSKVVRSNYGYLLHVACYCYSDVVCLSWKPRGNLVGNPVLVKKFHAKQTVVLSSSMKLGHCSVLYVP